MAITLRSTKGSRLSIAEADGNISDLDGRVTTVAGQASSLDGRVSALEAAPAISTLDDLSDVDLTTTPPTDTQALVFDELSGLWMPGAAGVSLEVVNTTVVGAPVTEVAFTVELSTNYVLELFDVALNTSNFQSPLIGFKSPSTSNGVGAVRQRVVSGGVGSVYGAEFSSGIELYPNYADFGPHINLIRYGKVVFNLGPEGGVHRLRGTWQGTLTSAQDTIAQFELLAGALAWAASTPTVRFGHSLTNAITAGTVRLSKVVGGIV